MRFERTRTQPRASIVLALLALATAGSAQRVTLKLNLPVGRSIKYTMTNKITSANPGGGSGPNVDMTQTMRTTVSATAKSAKGTKIRTRVDSAKFTAPPGSMMANQASQAESRMKGTFFEAIYDSRARMVDGTMTGTGMMGQSASQMGGMNVGFMGAEFPAGPIAPGATWSTSIDFGKVMSSMGPGMGRMGANSKIPVKFKFVRIETSGARRLAHLTYDMKGSVTMNMGGGNQKAAGMAMKIGINMAGKLAVDIATGVPVTGTSSGTTSISAGTGMNFGQKISVSFRQL